MTAKHLRIGFAWQTLTSENLGVAALAVGNLAIARSAAKRADVTTEFIEFCPAGPSRSLANQHSCEIGDPLSPRGIITGRSRYRHQIAACNVILDIGAGDSFSDIYGIKHFYFLCFSKWLALHAKVPLILSPQTIGPFTSPISKVVASSLMRRAHQVFARDHLSMTFLHGLGLEAKAHEVIDVAFRLPFDRREAPLDGRLHVGLNVSGLLYNGGYTGGNQFGLSLDYRALVERLVPALLAEPGVVLHLIGHVNAEQMPVEDDYRVCADLAARWPGTVLAPRFTSPIDAKTYISGLHFFAGARMHACIAAFSSGVPVVPMAYSRKFNGLFQSLGYAPLADMKTDTLDDALQAIVHGLRHRDALRAQVAEGNALAHHKLQGYEDYLTDLFRRLADAPKH